MTEVYINPTDDARADSWDTEEQRAARNAIRRSGDGSLFRIENAAREELGNSPAVMLRHLCYWFFRKGNWHRNSIWKSKDDWKKEINYKKDKALTARRKLREAGRTSEKPRLFCRPTFRVNWVNLAGMLNVAFEVPQEASEARRAGRRLRPHRNVRKAARPLRRAPHLVGFG
jgi:hypothetical protein